MREVARVVEHQATLWSYRATQSEERAIQLEFLIENTKPKSNYSEWHSLIATPFRYPPPETGVRTIFFVDVEIENAIQITTLKDHLSIIDTQDYSHSHNFVSANPNITFIIYPSCRDPHQRHNAAILDINHLQKNPKWESAIKFFYDNEKKMLTWLDYQLHINWEQIS